MEAPAPHFVGRAAELAELEAALAAARDGHGSTIFMTGEAGVGKTRLAVEFGARARAAGATVLVGRCIPLVGQGMAYLPLMEALRALPDPPNLEAMSNGSQLQLFEAVLVALDGLAADPLVLVLEDLHWADASTMDAVVFLAHAAAERRLVVLATMRGDEKQPAGALPTLAAELLRARRAVTIPIAPFGTDELGELLNTLSDRPVPADLVAAIHARSDGNPFFAEELLAAAMRGDDRVPDRLRDVLLLHIAQLNAAARSVLRVAAATGRDVPYRLLATVGPLDEPRLTEALRQAVEHGAMLFDQASATFRIRHALLAEAIYTTLLPGEREQIHVRLAHALADDPTLAATGRVAAELAHHWVHAGHPEQALAASVQAARDAEASHGLAEALRHVDRVIALWPTVPAAQTLSDLDLGAVLAWAAELCDLTGDVARAIELAHRSMDMIGPAASPTRRGLLHERLGSYFLHTGRQREALAEFRQAVDVVPAAPPSPARARILAALGYALMAPGGFAESLEVCSEATAVAEAVGDDRAALLAMTVLGRDMCCLGRTEEGIERLHAAQRQARSSGTPQELTRTYIVLADVLITAGRLQDAIRTATEGLAVAREHGLERSHGVALRVNAADALLATGDWAGAEEVLRAALRAGGSFWSQHPHLFQAQLDIGRGEFASARRHLEAGAHAAERLGSAAHHAHLVAELALWEGRPDDVARTIADGLHAVAGSMAGHDGLRLWAQELRADAELAQLAAARRDTAAVTATRRHARQLVGRVRQTAIGGQVHAAAAEAWQAQAEAEYARVTGAADTDHWRAAVAAWDELGRPYLAAYSRWRYAESLVAARAPAAQAAVPAREAHRVARRLGARPLRDELERLAGRARLDLVGHVPEPEPARADPLGLTQREREVLVLLGRGYTNRDIGAELTISAKTASVHVSNILRKLNASNRVEAATIAHRLIGPHPAQPG
jgi:ATP/maltotriose-dependent transcriptional regulator MalT